MPQLCKIVRAKQNGARKATPLGLSQSPETREIEPVFNFGVSSEELERAIRILDAAGLEHVAGLLRIATKRN